MSWRPDASRRPMGVGDLLAVLRIKAHTLRYWEQILPLVRARRDESGHRVWSPAQIRMLVRLRHLVVDRGMSVEGAGDALIDASTGGAAVARARIDACRDELLSVLTTFRAPRADAAGRRYPQRASDDEALPAIDLDRLIAEGVVAAPGADSSLVTTARAASRTSAGPFAGAADAASAAPVLVVAAHLGAADRGRAHAIATHLLTRRVAEIGSCAVVIVDATGAGARARTDAPPAPGRTIHAPAWPVRYHGQLSLVPTAALLTTLARDRGLDALGGDASRRIAYVWACDDPDAPIAPPDSAYRALESSRLGVALESVRARGDRPERRLTGGALIDLDRWRPLYHESLAAGGWTRVAVMNSRPDADTRYEWRYRLWLRDLIDVGAVPYTRPGVGRVPWTGRSWCQEVESLWADHGWD